MDQKEYEKILAREKGNKSSPSIGKRVSNDSRSIGPIEELSRGVGRGAISTAAAVGPGMLDFGYRMASKAGNKLSRKTLGLMGITPDEKIMEDAAKPGKYSAVGVSRKLLEASDKAINSKTLKGSSSMEKGWREGVKDVNWWLGNAGQMAPTTLAIMSSAKNAIAKEGAKHLEVLSSKTATESAKLAAKKQIAKISTRAAIKPSMLVEGAMQHDEYRKWEKQNPGSATIMGDVISTTFGAASGVLEGSGIGAMMVGPFVKKFGKDAGTKAATGFWKEFIKAAPKNIAIEGSTESGQQVIQNIGKKIGYDMDTALTDGVMESLILGGAMGGAFSSFEAKQATSGRSIDERDRIAVNKATKKLEYIKSDIKKYTDILDNSDEGSPEYINASEKLGKLSKNLDKQDSIISDISSRLGVGSDVTDKEAFGDTIDPSFTIDEIASGIDNGTITPEQWSKSPKDSYTEEEVAVVDQHVEDSENARIIDSIANGNDESAISGDTVVDEGVSAIPGVKISDGSVDGTTGAPIFGELNQDSTDEDVISMFQSAIDYSLKGEQPRISLSDAPVDDSVSELADMLGVRIVKFKSDSTRVNGGVMPNNPGVIVMNENTKRPEMWLLGHEFGHSLEQSNPEAFKTLVDVASKTIDKKSLKEKIKSMEESRSNKVTEWEAAREMLSDFIGSKFNDKNFWSKVHKENPSKFKEIINSLREYIGKIIANFKGVTPKSEKFFNDVVKLESTLVNVLNEHVGYGGAIEAVNNNKVDTGVAVDLNSGNKHWTHIPIGTNGQILMREDSKSVYIKRFARSGSMINPDMAGSTLVSEGKGNPTEVLNSIKEYADKAGKNVVVETSSNEYFSKQGFKEGSGGMVWDKASDTAADVPASPPVASSDTAGAGGASVLTDAERKREAGIRSMLENDKREAIRRIKEIDKEIGVENDVINTSTVRDDLKFAKENIDKLELEKKKLQDSITNITTELEASNDKEIGKKVESPKQQGDKNTGDTPKQSKSNKTDSSNRNKQSKKEKREGVVDKLLPKDKKLSDKINRVKAKEAGAKSKGIKAELDVIVSALNKAGKAGDGVAFAEAVIGSDIEVNTNAEEVAYQNAFNSHMRGEINDGPVARKKSKKRKSKRSKEEQIKLNVLTSMLSDGSNSISLGKVSLKTDVEKEAGKFISDLKEEESFDDDLGASSGLDMNADRDINAELDTVHEPQFDIDTVKDITDELNIIYDGYDIVASVKQNKRLTELANFIGSDLVIVKSSTNKKLPFGGMGALGKSNKGVAIAEGGKYPIMFIFGHEFSHVLQDTYPKDFSKLFNEALKTWSPSKLKAYRRAWHEHGFNNNDAEIRSEMIADFIGSKFNDTDFWDKLNLPKNIANSIITDNNERNKTNVMNYDPGIIFNEIDNMDSIISGILMDKISNKLQKNDIDDVSKYYRELNSNRILNFLSYYTPNLMADAAKFNNGFTPQQNVDIFLKAYIFTSEMGVDIENIADAIDHFPYGNDISDITGINSQEFDKLDEVVVDVVSQFINNSSTYKKINSYDDKNNPILDARFKDKTQFDISKKIDENKAFISPLIDKIKAMKLSKTLPKSLPANEWMGIFNKHSKKGKINPNELEFTFLPEWLSEKGNKNVTREDVISYLENSSPKITSKIRAKASNSVALANTAFNTAFRDKNKSIKLISDTIKNWQESSGILMHPMFRDVDPVDAATKLVNETTSNWSNDLTVEQKITAFKYSSKGRLVYNRVVSDSFTDQEYYDDIKKEYDSMYSFYLNSVDEGSVSKDEEMATNITNEWLENEYNVSPDELEGASSSNEYSSMVLNGGIGNYTEQLLEFSPRNDIYEGTGNEHWGESNVLAHVRYDDHIISGGGGKKVLMMYELQSDWQSDISRGLKRGFDVPRAPFKKTWPLLVFKHALIQAYNRGDKYVAWPSTSNQVSKIEGWGDRKFDTIVDRYTKSLPKQVSNFVDKYGSKVEKIKIWGGHDVFAVEITPKLEKMIIDRQIPQFDISDKIDPKDPHPEVEKAQKEDSKITNRGNISKLKNWSTALYKMFSSPIAEIRPGQKGYFKDLVRLAKEVDKFGAQQAFAKIYNITGQLSEDEITVFTRNIVLADILNDTTPNPDGVSLLRDGNLPHNFKTVDQVRESLRHFRDQAKKSPRVMYALANRRSMMLKLQGELIDAGFLPSSLRGNDAYFHHETIRKMNEGDSYLFGNRGGAGSSTLASTYDRTGDIERYSTDYITSEFSVVSNSMAIMELQKIKTRIKNRYDIRKKLEDNSKGEGILIPKGYVEWAPSQFKGWGASPSYPDMMGKTILEKAKIDPKVKEEMQIASGVTEKWVIPEDMATSMSRIREVSHENVVGKASEAIIQSWKIWTLINPFRAFRYNVNNLSGDVDIAMAYDWRIMKYTKQAMTDIAGDMDAMGTRLPFNAQRWGNRLSTITKAEMVQAHKSGVIDAGFVMHEVTNINHEFESLIRGPKGHPAVKFGLNWWQNTKNVTNFRENIIRLAAYRYFKDRLSNGEKGVYGASNPAEIDDIKDMEQKAAKLSRELIGDYGRLTEGGEWMRKHIIPFYSWMEINAPRYVRMMRNAKHEGSGKKGNAAIGLAWKSSVIGAKMLMFSGMVTLWNSMMFGDEEKELHGYQKKNMHIILGRRQDGSIRYLPISGAFRDALSWFGGEDAYYDISDIANGDATVSEKMKESGLSPVWKIYNSSRPLFRSAGGVATGFTTYPANKPRPIRDKWDYVSQVFSMELAYRWAAGKPTRGMIADVSNKITWNVDPGESAYYQVRDMVNKYNKSIGRTDFGRSPTDRSNALYYYKQSLRYVDIASAEKYWKLYLDLGGSVSGASSSVLLSRPTGGLYKKDRGGFYSTLSDDNKALLNVASKWYKNTYQGFNKGH